LLVKASDSAVTEAAFDIVKDVWPELDVLPFEKRQLADIFSQIADRPQLGTMSLPKLWIKESKIFV
jgi:hypothetical protein